MMFWWADPRCEEQRLVVGFILEVPTRLHHDSYEAERSRWVLDIIH